MPVPKRLTTFLALLMLALVSGCADDDGESADSASESPSATGPSVAVPAGVNLTDPGASLDLGQPASVVYDAGQKRVSVITVTVRRIVTGSMKRDFKNFVLGPKELKSTPYYVTATVRNAGPGKLGQAKVPLYGYDSTNTYFSASPIVGDLGVCSGGNLPESFGPKATKQTCQVFLVGKGATLEAVELRPYEGFEPIRWPVPAPKQKPKA